MKSSWSFFLFLGLKISGAILFIILYVEYFWFRQFCIDIYGSSSKKGGVIEIIEDFSGMFETVVSPGTARFVIPIAPTCDLFFARLKAYSP